MSPTKIYLKTRPLFSWKHPPNFYLWWLMISVDEGCPDLYSDHLRTTIIATEVIKPQSRGTKSNAPDKILSRGAGPGWVKMGLRDRNTYGWHTADQSVLQTIIALDNCAYSDKMVWRSIIKLEYKGNRSNWTGSSHAWTKYSPRRSVHGRPYCQPNCGNENLKPITVGRCLALLASSSKWVITARNNDWIWALKRGDGKI